MGSSPTTSRLPINQRRMRNALVGSVRYWMVSTPAAEIRFTATPESNNAPGSTTAPVRAIVLTSETASIAPANEAANTRGTPATRALHPSAMAMLAPSAPPPETPSV